MDVVTDPAAFRRALDSARAGGATAGLVPTMGALHAGHRSLLRRAAAERGHVAVSIFVNPLQFDAASDLERYPRDLDADLSVCEAEGVGTVFAPSAADMFPAGPRTTVAVAGVSDRFEGTARPGHFAGVATVCAKLFALAGPCAAYFGEKDFQQLLVVRALAADLGLPVEVEGCPTAREEDGLACSSRNALLPPDARAAAPVLWRALVRGRALVEAGEEDPRAVETEMAAVVDAEPLARREYAAAVSPADLRRPERLSSLDEVRLLVAARVGPVRLIDNLAAVGAAGSRRGAGVRHDPEVVRT